MMADLEDLIPLLRKETCRDISRVLKDIRALRARALERAENFPQRSERRRELLEAAGYLRDASGQIGFAGKMLRPATDAEKAAIGRLFA